MDPQAGQVPAGTDDGQVPSANPQAGAANAANAANHAVDDAPQAGDDVSKKVKKANEEAARYRIEAKAARDELQQLRDSLKTDEEKRAERFKELETLESTWRSRERALNKENAIALAVAGANTNDPEVLSMLLGSRDLELDEATGRPTKESLHEAISAILSEKPWLAKQAQASPTAPEKARPTSAGGGTNVPRKQPLTLETIGQLSHAEINARWAEIQEVLRQASPQASSTNGKFAFLNNE